MVDECQWCWIHRIIYDRYLATYAQRRPNGQLSPWFVRSRESKSETNSNSERQTGRVESETEPRVYLHTLIAKSQFCSVNKAKRHVSATLKNMQQYQRVNTGCIDHVEVFLYHTFYAAHTCVFFGHLQSVPKPVWKKHLASFVHF